MSKKYTLLTFKGICMNFLLELIFFILSHPVTSKQSREIVQIHMHHPVGMDFIPTQHRMTIEVNFISEKIDIMKLSYS